MPSVLPGKTLLTQYRIDEFVAQTPLGELYRATDIRNNKLLAFTLLPKPISENIDALKELERTSTGLRNISNANIAPYLGLFQTPTLAFILEEWIDGPSLRSILEKSPISVNEALIYVKTVSNALEALHRKNFLHLNLAPELIHINKSGEILLSGIAGSRPSGETLFKGLNKYPSLYLAPEQFLAETLSPATDTYSLSVLLYQLVTGTWINGKAAPKTNKAIRRVHLELVPLSPMSIQKGIPDHFSRMLLWALRKNPSDRLKTTTELLSSLAMGARVSVHEIPLRADLKTAPTTNEILRNWDFLPPLKPNIIKQDTAPLENRLAAISTPEAKKQRPRITPVPILIFAILAGFISLFWFVRPAPITLATPIHFTPYASDYTPPPTRTPLPRPTEEHGGRIAFTCTRGDFNQLCMVNRDGTGFAQLTDMEASNYYPTFNPDGSSLLFASNRNGAFDLYLLLFDEKQLFQLTQAVGNVVSPDYSPDGHTIVFANRPGDGHTTIWMVNSDGLNPHLVYTGTNDIVTTAWSPNSEKIAYAMSIGIPQEYEIYTMDADGKNHLRISQGLKGIGGSIDWSPDGNYLLVYAGPYGDKDIFRIDASNGKFSQITNGGNNAGAAYSPDGKYIVFNSMRNNDQADLYIMRADGTNQQQLTNDPEPDWGPQWSP